MTARDVPAVANALRVLRLLSARGPLAAAEVARDLDLPRSSVYELLGTMVGQGFVVHFPEERRYGLGVIAFELGSAYSRQAPVARLARPVLARLVDQVGQSCHLAVLHGRDVYYVVEERAPRRPSLVTDVGVRLPAHLTASGLAILAHLSREQLLALFPDRSAFTDRTGLGPTRLSELRTLTAQVRRDGIAVEDGTVTRGFASVAVSVLDHNDYPVAGLACTYPSDQVDGPERAAIERAVRRAADELSGRIAHRAR